jgi:tRNA threonylcarbamoyladenosine biosynthesis protein TsaB
MKLLALDTSSVACSVALEIDGDVIDRHEEQAREHTRLLMPMLRELFAEAALKPAELDAIVLGNGPGSFIGMRIAASVAQGLAFGSGLRIVPVSSLLAVAAAAMHDDNATYVAVCQDAHMNEVYLGLYGRGDAGLPSVLAPERLHDQGEIDELLNEPGKFVAAGFGWQRFPPLLDANRDYLAGTSSVLYPTARHLLPEGRRLYEKGGAIEPQDVVPAYLRQTVARPRADADP